MMQLKLVKTMEEQDAHAAPGDEGLPHGTSVLKSLVLPWARTIRIVCADSHFASVGTLLNFQFHSIFLRGVRRNLVS